MGLRLSTPKMVCEDCANAKLHQQNMEKESKNKKEDPGQNDDCGFNFTGKFQRPRF